MLKRNKALAIVLAFFFCMSFIAPALVAPSVAQASGASYSFTGPGEYRTDSTKGQDIGTIIVNINEIALLPYNGATGEFLTITLPSGMEFEKNFVVGNIEYDNQKVTPSVVTNTGKAGSRTVTIELNNAGGSGALKYGSTKVLINLKDVLVKSTSDEMVISLGGPGIFDDADLSIGKTVSQGSTTVTIASVKTFGSDGGPIDDITITENLAKTFEASGTITLRLPNGFSWSSAGTKTELWGLPPVNLNASGRDLTVNLNATQTSKPGRLIISGAQISVDDDNKTGEVSVNISGGGVTETDLVVANIGDYGITVAEDTVKELIAGKHNKKIGTFTIEEDIAGSLIPDRSISLTLPSGVKWTTAPTITASKGTVCLRSTTPTVSDKGRTLKYTVAPHTSTCKLSFEDGKVYVEPGFSGPIEVEIGGTAIGDKVTVQVAEVQPAVTLKAEGVKDIIIGSQNQKVADILIVENAKEAIMNGTNNNQIVLALDSGYKFYKKPVIEVTEGDLEIDSSKLNSDNTQLTLTIKYNSTKPSTIKLSDVYLTGFRSAPEGPVKVYLVEAKGTVGGAATATGSTALDEGCQYIGEASQTFSEASAGDVVVANCVTPADSGASLSFKINSNIYTVNGIAKVMDVAPYIKNDRTYVPMRFLAETLGAEVVWDGTAQTVTLTKGDDVVVFTVGSTTYTVNGEAKVADVAPEIASDRTMLPARYVAEAFGALVGWDAATQTVIVNQ